ncbi:MAG TPA: hypothetical protein VF003_08895 [Pseudonocardiaceae bacterium]
MASSVFPLRLDETDRYLPRRLALKRGQSANALVTMLVRAEIDRVLPGARGAYQRRGEVAEQVLRRRGMDPDSTDYQAARRHARSVLVAGHRGLPARSASTVVS